MADKSKATKQPPSIRDTAKNLGVDPQASAGLGMAFAGEAAMDREIADLKERARVAEERAKAAEARVLAVEHGAAPQQPQSLVDLCLTRQGDILTDAALTVKIPAPALLQPGERVLVRAYKVKPGTWIPQ